MHHHHQEDHRIQRSKNPKGVTNHQIIPIDSTSFHVIDTGDCCASFYDDIKMMIQSEKPLDIEKLEELIDKVVETGDCGDYDGLTYDPERKEVIVEDIDEL